MIPPSSERVRALLPTIRAFLVDHVLPIEPQLLARSFAESTSELDGLRAHVRAANLWAPFLPREHGGLGLSLSDYAHVSEELGRTPFGHYLFNCQAPDVGNMELLLAHGSAEHKERWLAR